MKNIMQYNDVSEEKKTYFRPVLNTDVDVYISSIIWCQMVKYLLLSIPVVNIGMSILPKLSKKTYKSPKI